MDETTQLLDAVCDLETMALLSSAETMSLVGRLLDALELEIDGGWVPPAVYGNLEP